MGDRTAIAWTDATWNPIRGCSRVSEGCRNCYAERQGARLATMPGGPYHGIIKRTSAGPRWTGEVRFVEDSLDLPLRWKRPRRIFVNSMSDLFHEKVPDEWIDRIVAIMLGSPQHTFQVLTKRPERMRGYLESAGVENFRHIWWGVSVEDRETYKQRVLYLANTPAAVRFVSLEPLLNDPGDLMLDGIYGGAYQWAIVGGESGPGARPFDLAWARQTIAQCRAAGVPVFVKQLGARIRGDATGFRTIHHWLTRDGTAGWVAPLIGPNVGRHPHGPGWDDADFRLCDRKGADPAEWPEDLRVREFPS